MKKYYIALQLIGISNDILIKIIELLSEKELKDLFENKNILELEFKYNIHMNNYIEKLSNKNFLMKILSDAESVLEKNKLLGIRTIIFTSKYYPKRLKLIKNPPAIIYIKGRNILKSDEKSIACIGTRNPTSYGINVTKSIVTNLTKEKFTIISGLAYGVDKISHEISLKENGRTIAVLAHGLDIMYPKEHYELSKSILENGGTLISEYPVGTKADKFRFVQRNRIVSGLSAGILMVEAKEKSGTRHTVEFAIEQSKKIFVPVFNKFSFESGLNIELLKNKIAIPIQGDDDYIRILYELGYDLKYDKRMINNLKNKKINLLLNDSFKNVNININDLKEFDSKLGVSINKDIYIRFKTILKDRDITVKDFFNSIILGIVNEEER
ncbi:DNA-protecting protein DprA [Clostridium perfringens]|uniref:DNA-processing protein DprA n=1 Tax=Clostridium perfringens TaxID=1502 RepID=UPI00286459AF|nr:DNA-protecting protein DprA [Clostridium perfringens]MDM0771277.1 DNA-processing protein DprA [Clostridium perfringens]MDM0866219.1 DNA-processing protein DprA [Clostridium perfringens]